MQSLEHSLQQNFESQPPLLSPTKFFHDAYDKSLTAIEDHPREATLAAVGTAGAIAAGLFLSRGKTLGSILGRAGADSADTAANEDLMKLIRETCTIRAASGEAPMFRPRMDHGCCPSY